MVTELLWLEALNTVTQKSINVSGSGKAVTMGSFLFTCLS